MRIAASSALQLLAAFALLQPVLSGAIPTKTELEERTVNVKDCRCRFTPPNRPIPKESGAVKREEAAHRDGEKRCDCRHHLLPKPAPSIKARGPPIPVKPPGGGKPGGGRPGETVPGEHGGGPPPPGGDKPPIGIPGDKGGAPPGPRYEPRTPPKEEPNLGFDGYIEKGKNVRGVLDKAISENKPDVSKPKIESLYKRTQRKESFDDDFVPSELIKTAKLSGKEDTFTQVTIKNKPETFTPSPFPRKYGTIAEASYNKDAKTVEIKQSYAKEDLLPNDVRLKSSEIHYQNLKDLGVDLKDLQFVVRREISNKGTNDAVVQARKNLEIKSGEGTFHADKPGTKMNTAFDSLSGTPNVRPIYHMLADHHTDFGGLKIVKIHTYDKPYILIELGH